jgi:hypothetical protein
MKTRTLLIFTVALLICNADSYAQKPAVIEASAIDTSVDPSSVTYTARDKNMYGQPMEVLVPKQFESEAGLIAVARRLAADNAKFRQVKMPVQIYSDDSSHRELAEYFHFESVHDLRITGPDLLVQKIIKMPKQKSSNDGSVPASSVTYKIVNGRGTRIWDIVIPPKFATEAGLIAVAKQVDKDTADLPVIAVEIYDNEKAWGLVADGKIDDSNEAFCKRHELASYERNLNANINRLRLYESVTGSQKKDISFTSGEPTGGIFSHQLPSPSSTP